MARGIKLLAGLLLAMVASFAGCDHATKSEGPGGGVGQSGDDAETPGAATDPDKKKPPKNRTGGPIVVLHTSLGELTIELNRAKAPQTVYNFLYFVESGHYNQTIFHQVDAGYVALAGSYTADLAEKTGRYPVPNEAKNGLKNRRGTIAMARLSNDIDSSPCQFFINLNDNPSLDHRGDSPEEFGYCVFGEVIKGMEVMERLDQVEVEDRGEFEKLPIDTVLIESVYRTR